MDTIVAISTAIGQGAISIIRLSGDEAIAIVNKVFRGKDLERVETNTINYGKIYDGDQYIDEVMVSVFKAPKTYTRENVVEINSHGDQMFFFPIVKGMYGVGGSLDFLVYPMAWFMYFIGEYIVNNNYALVIIIATIAIRSAAWPIYGKTNDMSLKMQLLQPEQAKIQAKYAGKTDKESQQRMSMETMQLYKKYKVSFASCLMPLVQSYSLRCTLAFVLHILVAVYVMKISTLRQKHDNMMQFRLICYQR